MSEGLSVLIGMSIAYVASLIGMIVAWVSYKRRQREGSAQTKEKPRV